MIMVSRQRMQATTLIPDSRTRIPTATMGTVMLIMVSRRQVAEITQLPGRLGKTLR